MAKKAVILKELPLEQAVRKFTDRDEPRSVFWRKYEEVREELSGGIEACGLHVLTYYGFGGIGKTSLVKQLELEMTQRLSKPVSVYYDFKKNQDTIHALVEIQTGLAQKAKFTFPLFEYGLYFYTLKTVGKADAPEVNKLLDKSPTLKMLISLAGDFLPYAGVVEKLVSAADEGVTIIRNYIGKNRSKAYSFDKMDAEELYQYLPQLFILDMQRNMNERTEPVVIFLDTYEALVNELSQLGDPLANDEWLRSEDSRNLGVVLGCPGVLWGIAGREKLKWSDWSDWGESLEQHLLGSLSKVDAMQFLEGCGISNQELLEGLWRLTDGIPLYLDLCVTCYDQLKGSEELKLHHFGRNKRELVTRFLSYASDAQKDNIFMLACLHNWTDDLITELARKILPNFSPTTYAKTLELSFVNTEDEGYYHIHQVVEEVLVETCPDMIRASAGKALLDKFLPVLQSESYAVEDFANALSYTVRGAVLCYPNRDALCDFYKENIEAQLNTFVDAGHFRQARPAVEQLEAIAAADKTSFLYTVVLNLRLNLAYKEGKYAETCELARELLKQTTEQYGEGSNNTLNAMNNLAVVLGYLGQHQEALEYEKVVLEKRRTILGEDHPDTLDAMVNLALTFVNLGQHQEALDYQRVVLEKRRAALGEDHRDTLRAMHNLAITLGYLGQRQEACAYKKIVFEKMRATLGEDHPDTLHAMHNLATAFYLTGQVLEAYKYKKIVLEKMHTVFGEDHPITRSAINNLAIIKDAPEYDIEVEAMAWLDALYTGVTSVPWPEDSEEGE